MEEKYLEFAKEIAHEAGKIMLKYFQCDNGSSYKYDNTIVTKADTEINKYLIKRVKETFPTHSVDGEEEQFGKSDHVWVCDPVDGTAMYARHIPVAVFSLALVVKGTPIVGVVYDPFNDDIYSAIKGKGAYQNDQRIHVNDIALDDIKSITHFDMWPKSEYNIYDSIKELGKRTYIVSIGSIARACMCVATGAFNLAIFPGTKHKNCDMAAAKIIVEEAGGKVTDFYGNDQRYDTDINGAIISNGKVHNEALLAIKKHLFKGEEMNNKTSYFDEYVSNYDTQDPDINYKYYHSYRVMNNMELLATKMNFQEKDLNLAKVIGLLHDIGRFEQDKLYNSFKDDKMDHGDYGAKVLQETNILNRTNIDKEDYEVVYKAIKNHNKFKIESNLTERELLFSKLIRDADKLDILYVLGNESFNRFNQDDKPISKSLEETFYSHKVANKDDIKSLNDVILLYFCYIYDIDFKETYQIISKEKYYDKIYERINRKDIFFPYIAYTNKYIKERID